MQSKTRLAILLLVLSVAIAPICWAVESASTTDKAGNKPGAAEPASGLTETELFAKLKESPNGRVDLTLKNGKSYIRSRVVTLIPGKTGSVPSSMKIMDADSGKVIPVSFFSIRSLSLDREVIYTAAQPEKKFGKEAVLEREMKAAAAEREAWTARAIKNGEQPWKELTSEEHREAEKKNREKVAKIKQMFPGTELYETNEFLFVSDMPRNQVVPYAARLDSMYDMMCKMYRTPRGASVWKGKCLVVAFVDKERFTRFELEFFKYAPDNAQGLCHQSGDGEVVISCYRGNSPEYFGQVLVHETSHGFIHRYRTSADLPGWVNEGMADWIAEQLVRYDQGVKYKKILALESMRKSRSLQGVLKDVESNSTAYGIATAMTDFLIRADGQKYAEFINGIKEGKTWEVSLKDAYNVTPDQFIAGFGQSIGVPDLRP